MIERPGSIHIVFINTYMRILQCNPRKWIRFTYSHWYSTWIDRIVSKFTGEEKKAAKASEQNNNSSEKPQQEKPNKRKDKKRKPPSTNGYTSHTLLA